MSFPTELLTLNDGRKIAAPKGLNYMTNFVLKEQGEWFEDEVGFIKKLIQPGMNALDIGANYGVFSTLIARELAGEGRLWCFEPTPDTAASLRRTIDANGLSETIELVELGLSSNSGEASFYLSENAELNSLTPGKTSSKKITIELDSLDNCVDRLRISDVEFIKLDAEGEEVKILDGAGRFFENNDPVVMFELKHGSEVNTDLINAFSAKAMKPYRLVPELNVLIPFEQESSFDGFLLNLFAMTDARARSLAEKGLLVLSDAEGSRADAPSSDFSLDAVCMNAHVELNPSDYYSQVLTAYIASINTRLDIVDRLSNLRIAFDTLSAKLNSGSEARPECLLTFSRVCFAYGERSFGVQILNYLIQTYAVKGAPFEVILPFIQPEESLYRDQKNNMRLVVVSEAIRSWLTKQAYSAFFVDPKNTLPYIDFLRKSGMSTPWLDNLDSLVKERLELLRQTAKS